MTNPLDSGFQAGPQSPFQAAPVAPLFVRDRYGSADSTSTIGEINADKSRPSQDHDGRNPWAAEGEESASPEKEKISEAELPPADGGMKAWSILAGIFIFEALIWGFPLSWGVFQSHYSSTDGPYKSSTYLPLVGLIQSGIFFLGSPLMTYLTSILPRYRRQMLWAGWPLCIFSLLAGSFVTSLPGLIATQGIMYALGQLIIYMPLMSILHEWFITRRGLAYSVVMCAPGVSGIFLPFITETLLTKLGGPTTLRIFALILAVCTGPILILLKPRLPPSSLPTTAASPSFSFLRQPLFYIYSLANTSHSLALFLPTIFLPQYASALSLSPTLGALLLALLAVGQVIGQLAFGLLSDRSNPPSFPSSITTTTTSASPPHPLSKLPLPHIPLAILLLLTTAPPSLLAYTAWGLSTTLPPLLVFAIFFPLFASGLPVLWSRMGTTLSPTNPQSQLTTFGLFSLQKGVGILLAGPASSLLVGSLSGKVGAYGAEGKFAGVVLLCGSGMLVAALGVGGWYVLPPRWRVRVGDTSAVKSDDRSEEGGKEIRKKWRLTWNRKDGLKVNGAGIGQNSGGEEGEEEEEGEGGGQKSAVQRGEEKWSEKVRLEEEEAVRQWRAAVRVQDEEEDVGRGRPRSWLGGASRASRAVLGREGKGEAANGGNGDGREREESSGKREWVGSVDSDAVAVEVGSRSCSRTRSGTGNVNVNGIAIKGIRERVEEGGWGDGR